MPLFDAAVHTFGTVGTGGFSIKKTKALVLITALIFIW